MPKLIVLNIGADTTRSVYRQLWLAQPGDVVVSPIPIDEVFSAYVCRVLGMRREELRTVVADDILTDEVLTSKKLIDRLRPQVADPRSWELMPAIFTPGVAALGSRLGLAETAADRFAAQDGPVLLNRKTHFRRLAVGAGLPVPEGSVVAGPGALAAAVARHLPRTGIVVVKRDDDSGGRGNIALTTDDGAPLPGNRDTRVLKGSITTLAEELWRELFDADNPAMVVETYHPAVCSIFLEYLIGEDGRAELLNSGTIRRRPHHDPDARELVWAGLDLPAELPPSTLARAAALSARIVELSARTGYRGHINVDAILTENGELLFNEVNARWGGSLTLHTLGHRLLGPDYATDHVIAGVRDVEPAKLTDMLAVLDRSGGHFDPERGEGLVVIGHDPSLTEPTECVVLAGSRARARDIEAGFRSALGETAR